MALHLFPAAETTRHEATVCCPCNPTMQDVRTDTGSVRPALVHNTLEAAE